jgi:hypothetical protein
MPDGPQGSAGIPVDLQTTNNRGSFQDVLQNQQSMKMALLGGCAILRGVRQSERANKEILLWIRERELGDIVASLVEGLDPLTSVGAQIAFLLEPLAGGSFKHIGELLADPDERRDFIADLREGSDQK